MRRYHGSPMGFYPGPPPQSFQDDPYGVGRMRQLEEGFVDRGINPYGLSHNGYSMPGPGHLGDGFMRTGASGSPTDSSNMGRWAWPYPATQREPGYGVNALPSASASGSAGEEAAIDV